MTIQIKHPFVSAKGDGGDATLVRPSNWNAVHSTSMASGQLIGRLTAGAGAFEEIPISAYMAGLLATTDQASLGALLGLFETGDVKYTFKTAASTGWVLCTGVAGQTIGSAASAASLRANADCLNLYVLLYGALSDTLAPVSGGRSGNATTDFNSNKTLTIPALVGYAPVGAGTGSGGISTRVLGTAYGVESYSLLAGNIPTITGGVSVSVSGSISGTTSSVIVGGSGSGVGGGGAFGVSGNASVSGSFSGSGTGSFTSTNTGGGTPTAVSLMQPSRAMNVMVKL